jgi:hypothetical protein
MIYNSIEHGDPEGLTGLPLPTDLAIARYLPNSGRSSAKWIIDQISVPIQSGDQFWFYFESESNVLLLGELSTIHGFFGTYALVEVSPILHFNWDHGWIAEAGNLFWIKVDDLVLDEQEQQEAQRAFLQHPTFSLLHINSDEE